MVSLFSRTGLLKIFFSLVPPVLALFILTVAPLTAESQEASQTPSQAATQTPPPEVDFAKVEGLLRKLTANQQVANLKILPKVSPSPVPGIWEIKFQLEANGMRQTGVLYLSGDKIILGNVFDLVSGENLTALRSSPPERLKYSIKDLDMEGRIPRGNPEGKLVIVEFSDFQCPYCRQATVTLKKLVAKYPDDVAIYYKHLPIAQIHPLAYKMAVATECAREQKSGAFWPLHDDFFSSAEFKTETHLRTHLENWAGSHGIKASKLLSCLDSGDQNARVEQDMADARKIGARATPTFLVNGEFIQGAQSLESFEKMLKAQ